MHAFQMCAIHHLSQVNAIGLIDNEIIIFVSSV